MRRVIEDVTAGGRARQIHQTPDVSAAILDPTDSRCDRRPTDPEQRRVVPERNHEIDSDNDPG